MERHRPQYTYYKVSCSTFGALGRGLGIQRYAMRFAAQTRVPTRASREAQCQRTAQYSTALVREGEQNEGKYSAFTGVDVARVHEH